MESFHKMTIERTQSLFTDRLFAQKVAYPTTTANVTNRSSMAQLPSDDVSRAILRQNKNAADVMRNPMSTMPNLKMLNKEMGDRTLNRYTSSKMSIAVMQPTKVGSFVNRSKVPTVDLSNL